MEFSYGSSDVDNDYENDNANNNDSRFKSKNLDAERRRRAKLNDRLLQLRALVPIITNMTKAYIIKDAITYIEELDSHVSELKDELLELGDGFPPREETKPANIDVVTNIIAPKEMKNYGIEPEVKVSPIDDNKLWIKIVYEKKMGGFTKLVEAITSLGLEFNDTNFTTSNGAAVISSCLEGMKNDVEETEEVIMSVLSNI